MRANGAPTRFDAGEVSQPGNELWLGQPAGGLDGDLAAPGDVPLGLVDAMPEPVPDGSGPEDKQLAVGWQVGRDEVDEACEVLEPVGLAGVLCTTATVPNVRVVSNVARGPMVGRNVRVEPLDLDLAAVPADDHRLAGIHPDERAIGSSIRERPWRELPGCGHDRSQAGRSPRSAARSA
jgi:hypothetical protein